jgi:hypothetical protein
MSIYMKHILFYEEEEEEFTTQLSMGYELTIKTYF